MELELDMMELEYMQQGYVSYNYQDQGLDDYVAQYDDFIRISSFQEEHDRQQSAGISPRCPTTEISHINFNQFVGNRPDNFAEFSSDETDYDETGILLKRLHDHFEVNDMLDYSAQASKNGVKYDQQIVSPGRLIYYQSSVNSQLNNQIDYSAGLSLGQANNGAAAASLQANYNYELGGISSEEERMITCSSSSSKDKKKSTSGALSSSSSKPANNGTDRSLKVHRDSHSITKRAPPFIAPPQYRTPIIIHTYSPKIIHTTPSKFMWLVQSLTGSSETRSRCLKNAPPSTSSAASMEAQDIKPSYHHDKPQYSEASMESEDVKPISAHTPYHHHDKPLHSEASIQASIQTASAYHHDKYHKLSQTVHRSRPSPLNSLAITPTFITSHHQNNCSFMHAINNPCTNSNHKIKQIVTSTSSPRILMTNSNLSSQSPSNLSASLTDYIELCSNITEQSSSPTSCCSTIEVSPRGALISARRDFEGANAIKSFISGGTIITPPAPNFERWPGDQLDSMEGSVHSNKCLANFLQEANPSYLSNLKSSVSKHNVDGSKGLLPSLRGPNDGNCNHVMNSAHRPSSTPNTYSTHNGALDRFPNKAISSPCLTTPFWDSYPMESFLTQEPI